MIKTTKTKARLAQSLTERLISLGRQNTLQSRRNALRILNDKACVNELFSRIAPLFKSRSSGFTRIIRYSRRHGDGAELVFLELTEKLAKPTKAKETKKEKPAPKKPPQKPKEPEAKIKPEEKAKFPKEKLRPAKELRPKRVLGGLRKLFKKERDSL